MQAAIPAVIPALLLGLLLFPVSLPAADAPVMRAENLGDTTPFKQPLLLAVANLDQRISTTTDSADMARLTHQRARVLEQLNRAILSQGGRGFAPRLPADELLRLRDAVSSARRSGDKTAEMIAILRLNSAILDQSFTDLLTTVARDWIRFAPAANFDGAFNSFEHRTAFNQVPFGRAVQRLEAGKASTPSNAEQTLISAYHDYSQRAEVYDAVAQSLFGFVKDAATSNQLLHWLGISTLIGTIDAQPWAIDLNASILPGTDNNIGQLISLGQIVAAAALFLALTGVGLILLPMLLRLLRRVWPRRAAPQQAQSAQQAPTESERFLRLLEQSFLGPLRILLVLIAIAQATRILFLRVSGERIMSVIDSLYVVLVVWALLRLIDNFVMLYSSELLRRYPTLRGELVNFLSSMTRFLVIVFALLYLLQHFGFDIRALLASLGIGGLAVAFAAKETIANIFGCISIIADDMFQQGDWIVTPNGEGTVIDVGLRSTKIRTFDNAVIFLPNAYVASIDVRNWNRRKLGRRIKFTLGLEYGSDMQQVKKTVDDIRAMLIAHKDIADSSTDTSSYTKQQLAKIADAMDGYGIKRTLLVYLDALGDSSIDILIYCFSKTVDWEGWLQVKQDVIFRCCAIVEANGLSIAFPSETLYLRNDSGKESDDIGTLSALGEKS
ncbi:small-conductance mechanosensitive channel [Thiorhodovibrio frisius]|uniref:Small-conductance mechanosensitive channel n=2 Tax=Thiorhodovibrio frisius TaxID=631362 RepID=H8Z6Q8_9GAMM|nr:small-conductance mechanosensitive channel [Thiorhodovibrio frisius]WPL21522.1 MscS family inner membrane protein YnaI [Thiorhodovibrio frisius]